MNSVLRHSPASSATYYEDKIETLRDLFGTSHVVIEPDAITINARRYPIIDDVIILLEPGEYSSYVRERLGERSGPCGRPATTEYAEDIQYSFGAEWVSFPDILPEHAAEFDQYFDLVPLQEATNWRVCDLGCGIGRWSYFASRHCKELVLVDFSDAIFVARRNLRSVPTTLFFMGNIRHLPFRRNCADLVFCLGVLHHLPSPALEMVRALQVFAPRLLCYLYYALDNRPVYFRALLQGVSLLRALVSRIRSHRFRDLFSWAATFCCYAPWLWLGACLRPIGWSRHVPLYEAYVGKSWRRIRQDVYDRFFTRIEQRVSRKAIMTLTDTFARVTVSDGIPYWHFYCERVQG